MSELGATRKQQNKDMQADSRAVRRQKARKASAGCAACQDARCTSGCHPPAFSSLFTYVTCYTCTPAATNTRVPCTGVWVRRAGRKGQALSTYARHVSYGNLADAK